MLSRRALVLLLILGALAWFGRDRIQQTYQQIAGGKSDTKLPDRIEHTVLPGRAVDGINRENARINRLTHEGKNN
jgi:hypothetical protein